MNQKINKMVSGHILMQFWHTLTIFQYILKVKNLIQILHVNAIMVFWQTRPKTLAHSKCTYTGGHPFCLLLIFHFFSSHNLQTRPCMTSISENEMNIQIPLCNVWYLNGILKNSLDFFGRSCIFKKKNSKYLGSNNSYVWNTDCGNVMKNS